MLMPNGTPFLEITEQPKQRGMRFRYECEGRSAGSIPGENTHQDRKSWPSVQIKNFVGDAFIRVSLVSKDQPPRPHPHSLVGKDCDNGICQVRVSPETQMTACFSNLGIQCMKRKEVADSLQERRKLGVDPFNTFSETDPQSIDIDLNIVRLCFEAFIVRGNQHQRLQPLVSNPIFDKKATCSAILRICRVDKSFGSCKGGDEVYLLCDKVQKDDISICFYHKESGWESYGEFSPTDVHRQVAIVFRTPPYKDQDIHDATKVMFKLKRTSDGQTSESKDFTYLPVHHDQPQAPFAKKRPFIGYPNHSTSTKALRKHLQEKVPAPFTPQSFMPRPSQPPLPRQFPRDIFRRPQPQMIRGQMEQGRQLVRPTAELSEEILDQFLLSSVSTPPFSPNQPASPYGSTSGSSMQLSATHWMPGSPVTMPAASGVQYLNSPEYLGPRDAHLGAQSTSGLRGAAGPSSSRNYENALGGETTSIDQINPTILDVGDIAPGTASIDSLKNVSFNNMEGSRPGIEDFNLNFKTDFEMNADGTLDADRQLSSDMKALSIDEDLLNIIKQEPNTESQGSFRQPPDATARPVQSPHNPMNFPTGSIAARQMTLQPSTYDLECSIPSYDLNEPQGNFSVGAEIDDLVSTGAIN